MFTIDLSHALSMAENYFPQIKKLKEEKEKKELRRWAKELRLRGQHLKKINQHEKVIVKMKKRIPPKVIMAVSLYKYAEHQIEETKKELQTIFGTGYAGFTGQYTLNVNIQETQEFVVEEGVTLSFEDESVDFVVDNVESQENITTKTEYKKMFKKAIEEKKENEKIKEMDKENPFVDDDSIFSEFDAHHLKNKNKKEKNKEAIAKLEKLFAS